LGNLFSRVFRQRVFGQLIGNAFRHLTEWFSIDMLPPESGLNTVQVRGVNAIAPTEKAVEMEYVVFYWRVMSRWLI
jgi:hypothetical protein